ncbi:MAG: nitrate/nitrite transporter NrtS [Pseudomonadota bacterium]
MESWWTFAIRRDIVARASKLAIVVGTVLVAINYGDRILAGSLVSSDFIKIMLTYCVPYCVATYSAVGALRAAK